jgi:hypothetical protein
MRDRKWVAAGMLAAAGGVWLFAGFVDGPEAASVPKAVVMRCSALGPPTFSYQVTALSHTPQLPLAIEASTVEGEGLDCALAIAELVEANIDVNKIKLQATEDALVVTVLY